MHSYQNNYMNISWNFWEEKYERPDEAFSLLASRAKPPKIVRLPYRLMNLSTIYKPSITRERYRETPTKRPLRLNNIPKIGNPAVKLVDWLQKERSNLCTNFLL